MIPAGSDVVRRHQRRDLEIGPGAQGHDSRVVGPAEVVVLPRLGHFAGRIALHEELVDALDPRRQAEPLGAGVLAAGIQALGVAEPAQADPTGSGPLRPLSLFYAPARL